MAVLLLGRSNTMSLQSTEAWKIDNGSWDGSVTDIYFSMYGF